MVEVAAAALEVDARFGRKVGDLLAWSALSGRAYRRLARRSVPLGLTCKVTGLLAMMAGSVKG